MTTATINRKFDIRQQRGFGIAAWICLISLYAPIIVLVAYSFNANESVTKWTEFSLDWYARAWANDNIRKAALLSLKVAAIAAVVSTVFATMAALATTRVRAYRGMSLVYATINQPLMVPEIVTAIAMVVFFALIKGFTGVQSLAYLIVAHISFCIPFAYLPIRARLEDMNLTLEQAAADLYATPWVTFRRITLPLLIPGVVGGAMLAFVVSLDDVVISVLVAGPGEETLPRYILGQIRRGVTPELNAMSTLVLALSVILVTAFFLITHKKRP